MKRRHALAILSATVAAVFTSGAVASDHLTIVVPFAPGASADVTTRLVAQRVTANTGRNIVIDNRPGSNGIVAAEAVKRARPDGKTMLLANVGTNAMNASLYEHLSYSESDFSPITTLWRFPSVLTVPASSPAGSAAELADLARTSEQGLNFGSAGSGSGGHVLGELFRMATGADMVHVPYRGIAPAVIDLMAGRIDFLFTSYASVQKQQEAGQLRVLAVASDQRLKALPEVPTLQEAGLGDVVVLQQWFGLVAPAGVSSTVVADVQSAFADAVRDPALVETLDGQGIEAIAMSPDEFAGLIKSDVERLGRIIRAVGARAD